MYISKNISEYAEKQVKPQQSEDDDTEGIQSEEVIQNKMGHLFTGSGI